MPATITKSYQEAMMEIVANYRETMHSEASKHDMAVWAIEEGLWEAEPELAINKCANDIATAMRKSTYVNEQGTVVRSNVATRSTAVDECGKNCQETLWGDIRTADGEFIRKGLTQKHGQLGGEAYSLYVQQCSVNSNHPAFRTRPIQFSFDFTEHVESFDDDQSADPKLPR